MLYYLSSQGGGIHYFHTLVTISHASAKLNMSFLESLVLCLAVSSGLFDLLFRGSVSEYSYNWWERKLNELKKTIQLMVFFFIQTLKNQPFNQFLF